MSDSSSRWPRRPLAREFLTGRATFLTHSPPSRRPPPGCASRRDVVTRIDVLGDLESIGNVNVRYAIISRVDVRLPRGTRPDLLGRSMQTCDFAIRRALPRTVQWSRRRTSPLPGVEQLEGALSGHTVANLRAITLHLACPTPRQLTTLLVRRFPSTAGSCSTTTCRPIIRTRSRRWWRRSMHKSA